MTENLQVLKRAYSIICPRIAPGNHMNMDMQTPISILFILLSAKSRGSSEGTCFVQAHVRQRSPIAFRDFTVFSILFETYKCAVSPEPSLLRTIFSVDTENNADI